MIDVKHEWRTREQLETALDKGCLWVAMSNGNYWQARRNGKTKTWIKDAARFRIPIKFGLRSCGQIDQDNMQSQELVISESKPGKWK